MSTTKCPNCGARLTCGCQKRVSNTGKACCQSCVVAENAKTTPTVRQVKK